MTQNYDVSSPLPLSHGNTQCWDKYSEPISWRRGLAKGPQPEIVLQTFCRFSSAESEVFGGRKPFRQPFCWPSSSRSEPFAVQIGTAKVLPTMWLSGLLIAFETDQQPEFMR